MSGYHLLEDAATVLLTGLDGDWTDEWRHQASRWLDDYRRWHETIQSQLPLPDPEGDMITKTGKIITDGDIEAWVNQAEAHG